MTEDHIAKGRAAGKQVRAVSHPRGGGHSPLHMRHEPNTVDPFDPKPKGRHVTHAHLEYPKWLHFDGEPSVLADDADHESRIHGERALAAEKKKPERKLKVEPDPAPQAPPAEPESAPEPTTDEAQ